MNKAAKLQVIGWGLSLLTVLLAVLAWGQGNSWHIANISTYNLFPVFGLTAFSLMWVHYIVAAIRGYWNVDKRETKIYFEVTGLIVLVCILLHPGLLIVQLLRDGGGLPPGSYLHYIRPGLKWAAILGSVSLAIFIGYEFHRIYDKKPWWKYVQYATDAAMFFIVIHALVLGRQLGPGWFRGVWIIYALSMLGAMIYTYSAKQRISKTTKIETM